MQYIALSTLIAVIGCFVALAGWIKNRDGKIETDAEWKGSVNGKLDSILGIQKNLDRVEGTVREQGERLAKVEAKASSAHKRIDIIEGREYSHHE